MKKLRKRVLFISDYLPSDKNSVAEILNQLLKMQVLLQTDKTVWLFNEVKSIALINSVKIISNRDIDLRLIANRDLIGWREKLLLLFNRLALKTASCFRQEERYRKFVRYFNCLQIIREEKPDLIVFLIYTPDEKLINICKKVSVPFVQVLYDTVVSRPGIDIQTTKRIERRAMEESGGYFVPEFFCEDYLHHYPSNLFFAYALPLLICKEYVVKAYQNRTNTYQCTYFGQIQSFRNQKQIMERIREIGMALDVFTTNQIQGNELFRVHPAVSGDDLWKIAAESQFLIAFDNSAPYAHYLPSKAYLYVSFTKPVIAFGDNEDSALIRFFKDYPYFYYQNIYKPLDGLLAFLSKPFPDCFDETLYDRYLMYSPNRALDPIEKRIETLLVDC